MPASAPVEPGLACVVDDEPVRPSVVGGDGNRFLRWHYGRWTWTRLNDTRRGEQGQ